MPRKLVIDVPDATYLRLLRKKEEDGFGEKDWGEWLRFLVRGVDLNPTMARQIHRGTKSLLPMWMRNFSENLPLIKGGKTLRDLIPGGDPDGRAVVVGRGPSVFRHRHLEHLKKSDYEGIVVATDGMLIECLKKGVVPDYVVSVDGSPVCEKWYDDPLVGKHGPEMTSVLCTQVSPKVTKLVVEAGFRGPYWFVPTSDRVTERDSITKLQLLMTVSDRNPDGIVSMDCGGNVGAASWVLSWSILRRRDIALVGMDYGYPDDMPLGETYYYDRTVEHIGALQANVHYETVWHPFFRTKSKIDPAFKSYRQSFLDMLMAAPDWVRTVNATEGGTLFAPTLECKNFEDWLNEDRVH